jgi:hypothetical protein
MEWKTTVCSTEGEEGSEWWTDKDAKGGSHILFLRWCPCLCWRNRVESRRNPSQKPALTDSLSLSCVSIMRFVWCPYSTSAGVLALNCGTTDVAPAQKDKPLLTSKGRHHYQTQKSSWIEHKLGHGSRWGSMTRVTVLARTSSYLMGLDLNLLLWRNQNLRSLSGHCLVRKYKFRCLWPQRFTEYSS